MIDVDLNLKDGDVTHLRESLKKKNLKISNKEIKAKLDKIENSQEIFPPELQQMLLVQLLHGYEKLKRKEVIIMDELEDKKIPRTVVLGAIAEDWPGMSNAILGIIHHNERNVSYIRGFTVDYENKKVGIVILCFQLNSLEECKQFNKQKKEMVAKIRQAAQGSRGKYQFLEDEAIKFEIYNRVINRFMEMYSNSDLIKIIEESGEILKFISSRSREYLEEREDKDLADLIINNYIYQNMIRSGTAEEVIKIKNFKTKTMALTGITFVCREGWFSIEDFLMTLNHIVPDHIIKHHMSFVTADGILVYRIEIVDRNEKPLNASLIKSIEKSMEKLITISHSKKFSKLKAIGGFEHYARAIIPFLVEELKKTKLTQVFIDMARRTEFSISIKLVLVSFKSRKKRIIDLSSKVCLIPGVTISSAIPTKVHGGVEINILRLKVNLSEFSSVDEIYDSIKNIIKKIYGDIRDFDEGFRDIYINKLNRLLDKLKKINPALIREIFFNIDELYKIEISLTLMEELVTLCAGVVEKSKKNPDAKIIFEYKNIKDEHRTIVIVSFERQKRLMSKLIKELRDVDLYSTRIEWNQRSYVIMVLSKDKDVLEKAYIEKIREKVNFFVK